MIMSNFNCIKWQKCQLNIILKFMLLKLFTPIRYTPIRVIEFYKNLIDNKLFLHSTFLVSRCEPSTMVVLKKLVSHMTENTVL